MKNIKKVALITFMVYLSNPIYVYFLETQQINQKAKKMQLYIYEHCPYCTKVINWLKENNLEGHVEYISVSDDDRRERLRSLSGKTQAPFLVDGDVKMLESDDIITYLKNKLAS